tara:strand:+ start:4165 stop:4569 length:405 start_codon:yes stop_codon:yes gene_type:complete
MAISKITTKGILDGTIAEADLADNSVSSAKVKLDILVAEDLAANAITTAEITNGAVTAAKLGGDVSLGAGYYIDKTGTVSGNSGGRDNLFRVNTNATTGNVTIAANNNASVTGPLTIGNGTTLTIASTGRLAII